MIARKKCKCSPDCDRFPTMSCHGYNYAHLPEDLKEKVGTKRRLAQKNRNNRLAQGAKLRLVQNEQDGLLNLWYMARRLEMRNECIECGAETNRDNAKYYRWSVCHIVPKGLVPSMATEPLNAIELCQQHHTDFDNTFDKAASMKCFEEAKRRFNLFKHLIPNAELRKVNPFLISEPLPNQNQ